MSPMEVQDCIRSHERLTKAGLKRQVTMNFVLSEIIVGKLLAEKPEDIPHPWDYYPELFEREKQLFDEADQKRKIEEYKEQRRKYVEEFNRRRH